MTVTDKSPKRFRFTLVSRLQNYALDVIENLIMANETFVSAGDVRSAEMRMSYQRKAMSTLENLYYRNIEPCDSETLKRNPRYIESI